MALPQKKLNVEEMERLSVPRFQPPALSAILSNAKHEMNFELLSDSFSSVGASESILSFMNLFRDASGIVKDNFIVRTKKLGSADPSNLDGPKLPA